MLGRAHVVQFQLAQSEAIFVCLSNLNLRSQKNTESRRHLLSYTRTRIIPAVLGRPTRTVSFYYIRVYHIFSILVNTVPSLMHQHLVTSVDGCMVCDVWVLTSFPRTHFCHIRSVLSFQVGRHQGPLRYSLVPINAIKHIWA